MAVGCCAEVADGLGNGVAPFTQELGTLFFKALKDEDAEVRRNAIYGVGCLCQSAGAALAPYVARARVALCLVGPRPRSHASRVLAVWVNEDEGPLRMYGEILRQLQPLFAEQDERAILDNLGGAVSRMILAQPDAVPLASVRAGRGPPYEDVEGETSPLIATARARFANGAATGCQVLPVYMQTVPPIEDFDEVHAVVRCQLFLLQNVTTNATVECVRACGPCSTCRSRRRPAPPPPPGGTHAPTAPGGPLLRPHYRGAGVHAGPAHGKGMCRARVRRGAG